MLDTRISLVRRITNCNQLKAELPNFIHPRLRPNYDRIPTDDLAKQLISRFLPDLLEVQKLRPLQTLGDGSCPINGILLSLLGNCDLADEIRLRAGIDMITHEGHYYDMIHEKNLALVIDVNNFVENF